MLRAHDPYTSKVEQVVLPSTHGSTKFADSSLDFVYIDGDHTYNGVLADILAWRPKIKPDGVMGGDDFDHPGVIRAVAEQFPGGVHSLARHWYIRL